MTTHENAAGDITFDECQIGKGLKPLAQHGSIVVGQDGTITLLGTKGDVIDTAPLSSTTAKQMLVTGGQSVSLVLDGRKYNVTPGWGVKGRARMGALSGIKAPKALVKLVRDNGIA
ncbi:hypothetical protein [Aeromicrobium chenweiae]|uniref:Uncharacterized protein n=1 Tax=Aeromicrobium chenweiae TaxID=2079793 RepID=A0A2S0WKS7_9ACTN|nr:hypothetical protein [Aeromicrobium chenweiae]AWB91882.1 hypothetical protein C3E78_06525 [Aeromicrobium chenweiae]TGN32730.1 hypothetical protein E4L97_08495 [Aeromicrobium chenweiae]